LSDLICKSINTTLDTAAIKRVMKQNFDATRFEEASCKPNSKN